MTADRNPEHRAFAELGLFPFLDSATLNDEYDAAVDSSRKRGPLWFAVALTFLTALVVVAASQTAANSTADEAQRSRLIVQLDHRRATLEKHRATVVSLTAQVASLEASINAGGRSSTGTREQVQLLGTRAGVGAVQGQGIEILVNNAPKSGDTRGTVQDRDLQEIVNGLWRAGAEAIAINRQRLTSLTAIRGAGAAITVNYQSLTPPYVIEAIGNSATLPSRFAATDSGAAWLDLQRQLGMVFTMTTKSQLSLGAASVPRLRYARVSKTDRPGGGNQR